MWKRVYPTGNTVSLLIHAYSTPVCTTRHREKDMKIVHGFHLAIPLNISKQLLLIVPSTLYSVLCFPVVFCGDLSCFDRCTRRLQKEAQKGRTMAAWAVTTGRLSRRLLYRLIRCNLFRYQLSLPAVKVPNLCVVSSGFGCCSMGVAFPAADRVWRPFPGRI